MWFYKLLDAIPWVRESLPRKLGFMLFIATQVTLVLFMLAKVALNSPLDWGIVLMVASFNLGSWVAGYLGMRLFLQPVEATAGVLRAYLERRPVDVLPVHGHDIVGQLMRDADYIGKRQELDSTQVLRAVDEDLLTGLYSRRAGKRRLLEDVARSDRGQMRLHFAFISLHGLTDLGRQHGNDRIDDLLRHVAALLRVNSRRSDWVARWSEHLFAIGFCDNGKIDETIARLHGVLEKSPYEIVPGKLAAPIAAIGVAEHAAGVDMQVFYDQARAAMKTAEQGLASREAQQRIHIVRLERPLDAEMKALMAAR
ncbi:MAG: diguanylate cyclase [Betaproteobacteria bacterium]|nr:diguanylate cyclase [Betaproteobacteria bacterium]